MQVDTALLGIVCTLLISLIGGVFAIGMLFQREKRNSDDMQGTAQKEELDRHEKAFAEYRADTQNKFKEFLDANRAEHTRIFDKLDQLFRIVKSNNGNKG